MPIHLKITLPLWKTSCKSSTGGVWISNGVAQLIVLTFLLWPLSQATSSYYCFFLRWISARDLFLHRLGYLFCYLSSLFLYRRLVTAPLPSSLSLPSYCDLFGKHLSRFTASYDKFPHGIFSFIVWGTYFVIFLLFFFTVVSWLPPSPAHCPYLPTVTSFASDFLVLLLLLTINFRTGSFPSSSGVPILLSFFSFSLPSSPSSSELPEESSREFCKR